MFINLDNNNVITLKTIYDYFADYPKKNVDSVMALLTADERNLIRLKYGHDLNNPMFKVLNDEQLNTFYHSLLPKIKRLLDNNILDIIYNDNNCVLNIISKKLSLLPCEEVINKKDYEKALELLMYPRFHGMMSYLNVKEIIVTFLRFGYVNYKFFSVKAISEYLNINVDEVEYILMKAMTLYNDNIMQYIDEIINIYFGKSKKRMHNI